MSQKLEKCNRRSFIPILHCLLGLDWSHLAAIAVPQHHSKIYMNNIVASHSGISAAVPRCTRIYTKLVCNNVFITSLHLLNKSSYGFKIYRIHLYILSHRYQQTNKHSRKLPFICLYHQNRRPTNDECTAIENRICFIHILYEYMYSHKIWTVISRSSVLKWHFVLNLTDDEMNFLRNKMHFS